MRRLIVMTITAGLLGLVPLAIASPAPAAGDSVGLPNPLQWKTTPGPSCKASTFKPSIKRGIKLSWDTSKKRSRKNWGPTTYSAARDVKTTRYYHNFPLVVDRYSSCKKKLVRYGYYPTKYKRYHLAQTFVKKNLSAWSPVAKQRNPSSGYARCFKAYNHPGTFKTYSTCNGYDLNLAR